MISTRPSSLPTASSSSRASRRAFSTSSRSRSRGRASVERLGDAARRARAPAATVPGTIQPTMGERHMKTTAGRRCWRALASSCAPALPAAAKTKLSFAFVTDPTHEMYVYALRQGHVPLGQDRPRARDARHPRAGAGLPGPPVRHRRDQHDLDPARGRARLERQPAVHRARPPQPRPDARHLGQARQPGHNRSTISRARRSPCSGWAPPRCR